jgi:hypothetical protein
MRATPSALTAVTFACGTIRRFTSVICSTFWMPSEPQCKATVRVVRKLHCEPGIRLDAERSLKVKETKKAREDVRIATTKIETLTTKLSDLKRSEPTSEDNRIFSMVYAGVIMWRSIVQGKMAAPDIIKSFDVFEHRQFCLQL